MCRKLLLLKFSYNHLTSSKKIEGGNLFQFSEVLLSAKYFLYHTYYYFFLFLLVFLPIASLFLAVGRGYFYFTGFCGLFHDESDCKASNGRNFVKNVLERVWQGATIEVLSWRLPIGTERSHRKSKSPMFHPNTSQECCRYASLLTSIVSSRRNYLTVDHNIVTCFFLCVLWYLMIYRYIFLVDLLLFTSVQTFLLFSFLSRSVSILFVILKY
jgi:hypothetical protein